MKIFFYAVSDELEACAAEVEEKLTEWASAKGEHVTVFSDLSSEKIGLHMAIKKPQHLKEPLNFLYDLAKHCLCDFVLGILPESAGDEEEEICYFGKNEGKPDMFEIACYLGFE